MMVVISRERPFKSPNRQNRRRCVRRLDIYGCGVGHFQQCKYGFTSGVHNQVENAQARCEAKSVAPQLVVGHVGDGQGIGALAGNLAPQVESIGGERARGCVRHYGQVGKIHYRVVNLHIEVEQEVLLPMHDDSLQVGGEIVEIGSFAIG